MEEGLERILTQTKSGGVHWVNGNDEVEAAVMSRGAPPERGKDTTFPVLRLPRGETEVTKRKRTPRRCRRA